MTNRGMVKWQPFNAVVNGNFMINQVLEEKNKIKMPILSDDQKLEIQEKLFEALNNKENIKIKFFKEGKVYLKEGIIEHINEFKRNLVMNDNFVVFFSQIIEIS